MPACVRMSRLHPSLAAAASLTRACRSVWRRMSGNAPLNSLSFLGQGKLPWSDVPFLAALSAHALRSVPLETVLADPDLCKMLEQQLIVRSPSVRVQPQRACAPLCKCVCVRARASALTAGRGEQEEVNFENLQFWREVAEFRATFQEVTAQAIAAARGIYAKFIATNGTRAVRPGLRLH